MNVHRRKVQVHGLTNCFWVNETNKNSYMYHNEEGWYIICSYDRPVLAVDTSHKLHRLWCDWSITTQNHMNAYLYWIDSDLHIHKADWDNMQVEKYPNLSPRYDYIG